MAPFAPFDLTQSEAGQGGRAGTCGPEGHNRFDNDREPAVCQSASVQISRMPLISLVGDIWKRTSKILRLGSSEIFVFGDLGRWSWVVGRGRGLVSASGPCRGSAPLTCVQ